MATDSHVVEGQGVPTLIYLCYTDRATGVVYGPGIPTLNYLCYTNRASPPLRYNCYDHQFVLNCSLGRSTYRTGVFSIAVEPF